MTNVRRIAALIFQFAWRLFRQKGPFSDMTAQPDEREVEEVKERLADFAKYAIPVEEWPEHIFHRIPGTRDDVTVPVAHDILALLAFLKAKDEELDDLKQLRKINPGALARRKAELDAAQARIGELEAESANRLGMYEHERDAYQRLAALTRENTITLIKILGGEFKPRAKGASSKGGTYNSYTQLAQQRMEELKAAQARIGELEDGEQKQLQEELTAWKAWVVDREKTIKAEQALLDVAEVKLQAAQTRIGELADYLGAAAALLGDEDRNDQYCLEMAGVIKAALSTPTNEG